MELMVTDSDVVEQAKGFLREILDISVEDAYGLLRRYAQVHGDQQVRVSRRLMSEPGARPRSWRPCGRCWLVRAASGSFLAVRLTPIGPHVPVTTPGETALPLNKIGRAVDSESDAPT